MSLPNFDDESENGSEMAVAFLLDITLFAAYPTVTSDFWGPQ